MAECQVAGDATSDNYDIGKFRELPFDQQATHFVSWSVSGTFAMAAVALTLYLMLQHARHYTRPVY